MKPLRCAGMALLAALATTLLLPGCGDDGDDSEEAFCDAADRLRSDVEDLSRMDITAEGTDGLERRVEQIQDDFRDLRESGERAAEPELDALDDALSDLDSSLDENLTSVVDAVSRTVDAAGDALRKFDQMCED